MPAVCDCFPELNSVTAAREARYRSDRGKPAPEGPQSSLEIKVTSIGNLNERVETRNIVAKVFCGRRDCTRYRPEWLRPVRSTVAAPRFGS